MVIHDGEFQRRVSIGLRALKQVLIFGLRIAGLIAASVPVVLAGDYNVVPDLQDIYPTRSLDNNTLIQPESREAFARLLEQRWTDALRNQSVNVHSAYIRIPLDMDVSERLKTLPAPEQ